MKKILIYGDSNTWGDNFILGKRIEDEKQWPNILQRKLGSEYKILQEGLPGRLAGNEETLKTYSEQEIVDILLSHEDTDKFVHSYDCLIALCIYFHNKDKDNGFKMADNYIKNSSMQEINMDINFNEILEKLINEINIVVKNLKKYTNKRTRRIR